MFLQYEKKEFIAKSFKYRLYPTKEQAAQLEWILARCCELYNAALQERKGAWNAAKRHPNFYDPEWRTSEQTRAYHITYYDQANQLPELKHEKKLARKQQALSRKSHLDI